MSYRPFPGPFITAKRRAAILASTYTSVVTISAFDNSLVIKDPITPANNYNGPLITAGVFNKFTYTRASTATFVGANGLIQTAASGVPRIEYDPITLAVKGYLAEGARTNSCLWSNDMTNAAWIKTTMTATMNQTGPDGVTNSASLLTATAGNATCLQAITLGSAACSQSVYIQRITGSGVINMTMDNGTTWTAIAPTALWTKVRIPTQTLANPIVGFRIVTSGDAVAVAYSQNENATWDSSPIPTTTVAVTRAPDSLSLLGTAFNLTTASGTLYVNNDWLGNTGAGYGATLSDISGTSNAHFIYTFAGSGVAAMNVAGTVVVTLAPSFTASSGVFFKNAYAYNLNDFAFSINAGAPSTSATGTPPTIDRLNLGDSVGGGPLFAHVKEAAFIGQRITNAAMQALTT